MPHATFVLSTGRCGTQWLTHALSRAFGDRARVEHEPLHNDYRPRRMLGVRDPADLGENAARPILQHAAEIERVLESRDYIETGHPCWSSVPWLARRFAGRVRIVHLVRHPVPTACSWVSHGAFVPPLLPHLRGKVFLTPGDAGVSFSEYGRTWATLSPLEKSLFYWAEVQALALRLEGEARVPWLRVRYEELFAPNGDALRRLMRFLDLPEDAATTTAVHERVDQHHYHLPAWPEPEVVRRHPRVMALAAELGYRADEFDADALRMRFLAPPA